MTTSWSSAAHAEEPIDPARVGDRVAGLARAVSDGAFRADAEDVVVDREATSLFCHPDLVGLPERTGSSAGHQVAVHRDPRIRFVLSDPAEAQDVLTAYYQDIVSRFHDRPATQAEVEQAMREGPSDDLTSPTGVLFVVHDGDDRVGSGGLRHVDGNVAEVTRVWIAPAARRRGLGSRLVRHLEGVAAAGGRTSLRLDTRSDLLEARAMYARLGYVDVEPFNDDPYAQHWLGREPPLR